MLLFLTLVLALKVAPGTERNPDIVTSTTWLPLNPFLLGMGWDGAMKKDVSEEGRLDHSTFPFLC